MSRETGPVPPTSVDAAALKEIALLLRDLWSDKQRLVSATATLVAKNRDFLPVHVALLRHLEQTGRCFQAIYAAFGGDVSEIQRK